MEITGRIIADATVSRLTDGREVTGFTIVQNDAFKTRSGERKNVATFFKCTYWLTPKTAAYLKKGTIVTLYGRVGMDVYKNRQGEAQGSLTFHVNDIRFVAKSKATPTAGSESTTAVSTEDLPF